MGLVKRKGDNVAYYRSVRVDGRIKSIYVASGEAAKALAAKDKQEAERQQQMDALAQAIARFCSEVDNVLINTLEAAGYHRHKGQWRKARK